MQLFPRYTHIVNKRLKHTYLSFDEEANLIIKSPKVSRAYIETLLIKKAAWINAAKEKILLKKGRELSFSGSGHPELYLYGKTYPLLLKTDNRKHPKLLFDRKKFTLLYSTFDTQVFQRHIDRFYKKEAEAYMPARVDAWAETMKSPYRKLSFRKTKRQWGSCSSDNAISFNTMVVKLPPDVIQYIIVHELAHIEHKHHQKDFWSCVEHYLPEYKACVSELKTYTTF